jgi:hypothetical protein
MTDSVSQFYITLVQARERMLDLMRTLWRYENVSKSRSGCDLRRYGLASEAAVWTFEAYVEADLNNDQNICWWAELTFDGSGWKVAGHVSVTEGDTLLSFLERRSDNPESAGRDLQESVQSLIESINDLPQLGLRRSGD